MTSVMTIGEDCVHSGDVPTFGAGLSTGLQPAACVSAPFRIPLAGLVR